jgi:hypothetical protein
MLAAIGGSAALLVALFMLGRGEASWSTAGGVLVVACLGICLWGALQGRRTEADIDDAVALMIANRQARSGPRPSPRGPERASREAGQRHAPSWGSARAPHSGRVG